jgi:hypothetical protein
MLGTEKDSPFPYEFASVVSGESFGVECLTGAGKTKRKYGHEVLPCSHTSAALDEV